MTNNIKPDKYPHPGETVRENLEATIALKERWQETFGMVPHTLSEIEQLLRVCDIMEGRASIDEKTADYIASLTNTSSSFWLSLQENYNQHAKRLSNKTEEIHDDGDDTFHWLGSDDDGFHWLDH